MAKLGTIIGAGLGFVLGGPIGLLVGSVVGSFFNINSQNVNIGGNQQQYTREQAMSQNDFYISLLVLIAAVMKADGVVMRSELDYVKRYLRNAFGENRALTMLQILKGILEKPINLQEVCTQIRVNMQYESRLQLIHFLYELSASDGKISAEEVSIIKTIAQFLNISQVDADSIHALFMGTSNIESDYQVLEVSPNATDAEVKRAYKKMAMLYHPDKVSHLGEEVQKSATEKFRKLNEAYERIKKQRNIN